MQCVSQTVSITVWLTSPYGRCVAGASQKATVACKYFHTDNGLALSKVIWSVIVYSGDIQQKGNQTKRPYEIKHKITCNEWKSFAFETLNPLAEGFDRTQYLSKLFEILVV